MTAPGKGEDEAEAGEERAEGWYSVYSISLFGVNVVLDR